MPISSHAILPYIVEEVLKVQPKKVLDVGIGHGIYGALIFNYASTLLPQVPKLIGIEPWEPYNNHLWEVYDEVHLKPLQEFKTKHTFDLIIMADVIEHMKLNTGHLQISRCKKMLSPGGVMIISTPAIFQPQGAYMGNVYEEHKSLWDGRLFKMHGFRPIPTYKTLFGEQMLIYKFKQEERQ